MEEARYPKDFYDYPAQASAALQETTVMITGANSGIGFSTAANLARRGARILLVCRDAAKGKRAAAALEAHASGAAPSLLIADLSSQSAVRAVAAQACAHLDRLDVLINNAGACFAERELTGDGYERTFATNYLGPFLLTNLLLDLLKSAPNGRIVNVTSEVYASNLDLNDLQSRKSYNFLSAYVKSKLANILFSNELAVRLAGSNATSNAVSPGPAVTAFGDNMTGVAAIVPRLMKRMPFFKKPAKACTTIVYLAAAPELTRVTGKLFMNFRELKLKPVARNSEIMRRLWRASDEMTHLTQSRRLPSYR